MAEFGQPDQLIRQEKARMVFLRRAGDVKVAYQNELGRLMIKARLRRDDLDTLIDIRGHVDCLPVIDATLNALISAGDRWLRDVSDHIGILTQRPIPDDIRQPLADAFMAYCRAIRAAEAADPADDATVLANEPRIGR